MIFNVKLHRQKIVLQKTMQKTECVRQIWFLHCIRIESYCPNTWCQRILTNEFIICIMTSIYCLNLFIDDQFICKHSLLGAIKIMSSSSKILSQNKDKSYALYTKIKRDENHPMNVMYIVHAYIRSRYNYI